MIIKERADVREPHAERPLEVEIGVLRTPTPTRPHTPKTNSRP